MCFLALGLSVSPALRAQDQATQKAAEQNGPNKPEKDLSGWNLANFLVLAALLAYLGAKYASPYFRNQSETLANGLAAAHRRKEAADQRSAEVDRKLANLGADIEQLRSSILHEQDAQVERMRKQAELERERIKINAAQQIDSAGKRARLELQRFASRLAIELAEQRARSRMSPGAQKALTDQFVEGLRV